jgi:predicted SAM-dependent methyltransferase
VNTDTSARGPRACLSRGYERLRYVAKSGARRRLRDFVLTRGNHDRLVAREDLARRYLRGQGIEIGPLFWPLRVLPGVRVRNVDYLDREGVVRENTDLARVADLNLDWIPEVDVVDDAQRLASFADGSLDFVVANHVIEHTEDPIAALEHALRVLREGGILFLTLPDARHTFDSPRPRTTVGHLLRDHGEGPAVSRPEHYREWAVFIDGASGDRVSELAAEYAREAARHHFHAWELQDFLALLRAVDLPCELELAQASCAEFAVILRKT